MVERFLALAYPPRVRVVDAKPIPKLVSLPKQQALIVDKLGLTLDKPVLALCPGAEYGPAKQWPASHFAGVARYYLAQGWQVWLLGGPKDKAITAAILAGSDNHEACIDLAGKTSLTEVIDLLAQVHGVVTNDSGLMHVAAALGRPLVAIYGSSTPNFTPPLTEHAVILKPQQLVCSPCFERTCRFGHYQCLTSTEANQVIKALGALLEPNLCPA
jgi:heptosyltransferase-2